MPDASTPPFGPTPTRPPEYFYTPTATPMPTPTPVVYTTTTITVRKYYFFGSQRVAIRETNESHNYLHYLHWDHLGSTVMTTWNSSGTRQSERGYYAFGDDRRTVNTPLTDHLFTGQKQDDTGLYYYNARYYDPEIGHFISPDTLVPDPGSVFGYNRYMYAMGNPLKFSDPSGHCEETPDQDDAECWYLLQRLLHGTRTQGIYEYEEAMAWNAGQIKVLIDYWAANNFNDMNPDAVLVGGGGSIRFDPSLGFDFSARAAVEYIHNYESGENDLFVSSTTTRL